MGSVVKKTEKYFIATFLSDGILSVKVEVSKTKFSKIYNETLKQYYKQEKENEFYVEQDMRMYDHGTYTERIVEYTYGISYVCFTTLKCKDGYYFNK